MNQEADTDFYKKIPLKELNESQWESICDGCGLCCFRKFVTGYGKKKKLFYTSIACDFLELSTGLCTQYKNRFKCNPECIHLTKNNVSDFKWLPETCAYRLLAENKELPLWHPLFTQKPVYKNKDFIKNVMIKDPVHEKDVEDWEDYIIKEE